MNGTDRAKLCYANSVRVFCFFLLFGVEIGFSWSTLIYFALRKVRERERESRLKKPVGFISKCSQTLPDLLVRLCLIWLGAGAHNRCALLGGGDWQRA